MSDTNTSHLANYVAIKNELQALKKTGKIADLGAGIGEFVAYTRNLLPDADIFALDWRFNEEVKTALSKRNITCVDGDFQSSINNLKESRGKMDLITAWEVIEHIKVEDITIFLDLVSGSLAQDGLFILSTPDFNDYHCQAMDFWSVAPGEHISVLSRRFLEPQLNKCGLKIIDERHESVMMKNSGRWFLFGAETDSHFSSKARSRIIDDFLCREESRNAYNDHCRRSNIGSEIILLAKHI